MEHYIETLDDPELADQLAMLSLTDVEDLQEGMRARQRTKLRRGKTQFGSNKYRQKLPAPPNRPRDTNCRSVQAVRATSDDSSFEGSRLASSDNEGDLRRVF